ncbi:unnamed protein product [Hymenolepis diminuta]|uniref:Uncharacterized protein n=1 Tax=Hymenolepis diminuta TaxID=6216 RepID=A0A564YEF7_HYMDI|nr:unnamed protein product [Hymenolepis diminuta]
MSKRVHLFPLFSITPSLHIKGTSALMLWRGLTQVTHIKLSLFSRQGHACRLRAPMLLSLSLSLLLVVVSLTTFWSTQLLVFCFTIFVSSYSNSYELVTVIVVVIC